MYEDGKDGFLKASSPTFTLDTSLIFQNHLFRIMINKFQDYQKNINIHGNLILKNTDTLELTSSIYLNIHNDAELKIYTLADEKKLLYKVESLKNIENIENIVNIFNLDKAVKYWVYDAIQMSSARITSANGFIEYSKPEDIVKNIHVKAIVNDLDYTYHTKIKAINTQYTNLEFIDGILFIRPHDTSSYGMDLGDSWLKIDFSKKEELLTLYLLFDGRLNDDMLYILNTYNIKIPFKQISGSMQTNLRLIVNLRTIDVEALGTFKTSEASINYLGLNIDIFNTMVKLNNFDVIVKNMHAKYNDIAVAMVDLDFNAKNHSGVMNFEVSKVDFKDYKFKLNQEKIKVSYLISPKQDYIILDKSSWLHNNTMIDLKNLKIPFKLDTLTANIPNNTLTINEQQKLDINGIAVINPIDIDLNIKVKPFNIQKIELNQEYADFSLKINKKISLKSLNTINLKIAKNKVILDNIKLSIKDNYLNTNIFSLDIEDALKSKLSLGYNLKSKVASANIHDINLSNPSIGNLFTSNKNIAINIKQKENKINLDSSTLDLNATFENNLWRMNINNLSKIYKQSSFLQNYSLKDGNISLFTNNLDRDIHISSKINFPHKILAIGDTLIDEYIVKGTLSEKSTKLNINGLVDINIAKAINIDANNIGININETMNFINDTKNTKSKTNTELNINIKDSYIYLSKARHALADEIKINYKNNLLEATLMHKDGEAWFSYKDNNFKLYGNNFGDKFMNELFALSHYEKGRFEFSVYGEVDKYKGMFYIEKTTIHDFVLLNNILAFVNTVPSLITFSLPGYNSDGFKVDNAYSSFEYENNIYKIDNIAVNSKELNIVGSGNTSIKNNTIDLKLNLQTDLGSSVSKVPVVGYILLGEETISTSLKIKGKLNDPKISTRMAKDIAVAPLNIIKRTFLLPFHLIIGKNKK